MKTPLQRAIDCLRIRDVSLRETSAFIAEGFEPAYDDTLEDLQLQFKHNVSQSQVLEAAHEESSQRIFRVFIELGVRWVEAPDEGALKDEKDSSPRPVVKSQVEATFAADYDMIDYPDQDALDAFAVKNASYHVWPYWREYLASQCQRMGLPKIVLPAVQFARNDAIREEAALDQVAND